MPLWEFTRFIWWMQTQRQVADPQTKPIDLGCESAGRKAAIIHIHHSHFIITQPKGWYSFYYPTEGRRLSRPRHCSKGAQPLPKAVYRSGCRDKHNHPRWDLNPGPFTPQSDALTTRPLRPAINQNKYNKDVTGEIKKIKQIKILQLECTCRQDIFKFLENTSHIALSATVNLLPDSLL